MDFIELNNMTFHSYHGVLEQERKVGNEYTVDLKLFLDLSKSMQSDLLEDTINYAEVWNVVKQEMAISSQLLEHVAGRIIQQLRLSFPSIQNIEIRLAKKNPPMGADLKDASVFIRR
jgi:dihydroneopterin aldolase